MLQFVPDLITLYLRPVLCTAGKRNKCPAFKERYEKYSFKCMNSKHWLQNPSSCCWVISLNRTTEGNQECYSSLGTVNTVDCANHFRWGKLTVWFFCTWQYQLCIHTNVVALILLHRFFQSIAIGDSIAIGCESRWENRMTHPKMDCILFQPSLQGDHWDCGICSLGLDLARQEAVFKPSPIAKEINSHYSLSSVIYGVLMQCSLAHLHLHDLLFFFTLTTSPSCPRDTCSERGCPRDLFRSITQE